MAWTQADIPDLTDRVILVTGATSGLGLNATRLLLAHNATVIMACRDSDKMSSVAATLLSTTHTAGRLLQLQVDLCTLPELKNLPMRLAPHGISHIDALLLNAGIASDTPLDTPSGLDGVFVTNVLAHWQLTGLLLPLLLASPTRQARVVPVSSIMHLFASGIDYGAVRGARDDYRGRAMYSGSKLAAHWFALELNRRIQAAGLGQRVVAVAAHPGYAQTSMTDPTLMSVTSSERWLHWLGTPFRQTSLMGAMPLVRGIVDEDVVAGDYLGPGGLFGLWGAPVRDAKRSALAEDGQKAGEMWAVCEQLSGFVYDLPPA